MLKQLGPLDASNEPPILNTWRIVWRGRFTILAIVLLVGLLAFLAVSLAKPVFEATAIIEIKPEARRIIPGQEQGVGAESSGWLAEERYFSTQLEVIASRDIAQRAFKQLHLENHPKFAKARDPIAAFRGMIAIKPKVNTRLVGLSMRGEDPREVRDWVNTVADVYCKRNVDVATQGFQAITDEIQKGLEKFRVDLGTADFERMKAAASQELFVPENQQEMLKQSLQTYSDGLSKVNVQIASLQAEIDGLDRIRQEHGDILSLPRFGQDPELQNLSGQRQLLERDLERLAVEKKPKHPDYLAKASELQKVQQSIDTQIATLEGKIRSEYAIAKSNADYLRGQIRREEEAAFRVKQQSSDYETQKNDSLAKRKVYDVVAETVQKLIVSSQLITMNNNIVILDRAIEPTSPVAPRKVAIIGVGLLVGLLFGVGVVIFMDYVDNTIRTPDDVEHFLGVGMLGLIPKFKDRENSSVREAYQSLRTNILFASRNREHRVVLLTSTGPQEGKSTTIAALGRTLASSGDRVVVFDCDLRRPTQHLHHEIPREPGITNYLLEGADGDYARFLHNTPVPSLKVFASGAIPPNPADLVSLSKFRSLVASLKKDFDWVLIDSPPIGSLADSVVLASMVDMAILVVKQNQNDRSLVRRSLKRLHDVNAHVIGAILNNVDLAKSSHRDYYYAGYYYESDEDAAARGPRSLRRRSQDDGKKGERVAL